MPFTPIHMGPGILIKSLLHGSFSLMVFGWAQIIMDLQPLIVILTGVGQLHGFSHTYVGATLIAVFAAASGKPLSEYGLVILHIAKKNAPIHIAWWVAILSAFIGTHSHVLIDSFMHWDMEPLYPFSPAKQLAGLIGIGALHKYCLYAGLVGTVIYALVRALARR